MQRILITGGAGFIGSHLAELAEAHAAVVRVLDDLSTGRRENLAGRRAELVEGSILDRAAVRAAVAGADTVFHLAAFVSVPESLERPAECSRCNVDGLRIVLEEAAAAGVRRFCLASSAAVYGPGGEEPRRETMPPDPRSPYAQSKLAGEELCRRFTKEGRLEAVALRFFNVFGPRQRAAGGYAAVVPDFMRRALAGEALTIHGDGGQTRDFVFVRTAVAAALFAAGRPGLTGVFNVGAGNALTIRDLAGRILRLTGSRSPVLHVPERPGDVRHSRADPTALRAAGFQPADQLDAGLAETLEHHRRAGSGG